MSNNFKYYLHNVTYSLILLLANGAIFQTVLVEGGISEEFVNFTVSAVYILQLVVMTAFSRKFDTMKNIIKTTAYIFFLLLPILFVLFLICARGTVDEMPFSALIVSVILFSFGMGMYNVIMYKLPYHIIDMSKYGRISSVSGIMVGIGSLAISGLISWLSGIFEYFSFMKYIYAASFGLFVVYMLSTLTMKNVGHYDEKPQGKKINIFKYKPFYALIIPNFIRGFVLGIIQLGVTIGYYAKVLDGGSAATLVSVTNIVTIGGCFVYSVLAGRVKESRIILISSIAVCIFTPLMMVFGNTTAFITFYGIAYFFVIIVNYATPVAVTKIMGYSVAGQYSAGRILINTGGLALGGFVCIAMFKAFGIVPSLIAVGLLQLVFGVWYYIYLKRNVPLA